MDQHTAVLIVSMVGSLATGWLGQHYLKGNAGFNTTLAHALMGLVAFGLYALGNPFPNADAGQWISAGILWSEAVIGAGSTLAGAGLAAKTDSRQP
jgi:hypothetical protein